MATENIMMEAVRLGGDRQEIHERIRVHSQAAATRMKAEGLENIPVKVALMGCIVNGPGEAREADIGIAGADGWGMIFEKGVQVEKLPYDQLLPALLERIDRI